MSLRSIHLRKLLKIMYLPPNRRVSALRSDIREDIAREDGSAGSGGDFYGPFWRDAKDHVFGVSDLRDATRARIDANPRRANLYPQLADGFLLWWDERRRWTNEPFRRAEGMRALYRLDDLGVIKVANILSVRDARDEDHFVYPYWFADPPLPEEGARLGLWLLGQALPQVSQEELRILDVIRGGTFSVDRNPLHGDEERIFRRRHRELIRQWDALREEYD